MTATAKSQPFAKPDPVASSAPLRTHVMDANLSRALDELVVAQSEIDDMAMRNIVAAETVELISTLVKGRDGDAISEVAGMILEACTLADVIGQRMMKVSRALEAAQAQMARMSGALSEAGVRTGEPEGDVRNLGVLATGPALTRPKQADIDALFG